MREGYILVVGAYGFIGSAISRALTEAGHQVRGLGRDIDYGRRALPELHWAEGDLRGMTRAEDWSEALDGVTAVVNAAGVLQDGARDSLAEVHDTAIRALLTACETAGVQRFVQISAAGVAPDSATGFFRSKARGDAAVRESGLAWVILRPGLVIGAQAYGGTALIRALACFPLFQPLAFPDVPVQTVALADVARAAVAAVESRVPSGTEADLVAPQPLPLHSVIAAHRRWLGHPAVPEVAIPRWLVRAIAAGADALGHLGWRSPLRSTAMTVMKAGVRGDPGPWQRLTGETLPDIDATLAALPATSTLRKAARLYLLMPLTVGVLCLFWLASGAIGLWRQEAAAAVLTPAGIAEGRGLVLVWIGALADLTLGAAILYRPWARVACLGMVALSLGYLAWGAILSPWLWADPLGPMVKVMPGIVLALLAHTLLEAR